MNRDRAQKNIYESKQTGAAQIVNHAKLPTREKLIADCLKAQAGDTAARSRVIEGTCRMAYKIAEHYYILWAPKLPASASFDDVFQAALEGLCVAVDKYRPETGCAFTTCATPWIRNYIQRRGIYPLLSSLKVPERLVTSAVNTDDPILGMNDCSIELDKFSNDGTHLGSKLVDSCNLEEEAIGRLAGEELCDELRGIDERLPLIARLVGDGHTTDHAALHFGVTGQRVRMLLAQAAEAMA